jgi:AcrR family transcriptional regulator
MSKRKQNLYGQEMGDKGAKTRAKILTATESLIEKRSITELKVSEIGSLAGVSSSTFYLYFQTVLEAALAVANETNQSSTALMEILNRDWTHDNVLENAQQFVKEYFSYWAKHASILRIRNFSADEGDRRFFDARRHAVEPIHFALQAKLSHFQSIDKTAPRLHPPSTASVLLALLERTAAIVLLPSVHKATRSRQIEVVTFILVSTMVGHIE